MILTTAAAVGALGLVLFGLGFALDRPELAMFGAIFVIGVGAGGMVDGYQVAAGDDTRIEESVESVALADIGEAEHLHTRDVSSRISGPAGIDAFPEHLYLTEVGTASVYQYSTSGYDLSLATFERSESFAGLDGDMRSVEVERNGSRLYVAGTDTDRVYQLNMSDRYNVSTAVEAESFNVSQWSDEARGMDFAADGSTMHAIDHVTATIHSFDLAEPYNVSTASHVATRDVSSQEGAPTTLAFSANGTLMALAGEGTNTVYKYELDEPYDVSTASYDGSSLDVSDRAQQVAGASYTDEGRTLLVSDRQDDTVRRYDTSTSETITVEEQRTHYEDVEVHTSFPVDIVVLLLGAVMLMGSSGAASETDLRDANQKKPPWERGR